MVKWIPIKSSIQDFYKQHEMRKNNKSQPATTEKNWKTHKKMFPGNYVNQCKSHRQSLFPKARITPSNIWNTKIAHANTFLTLLLLDHRPERTLMESCHRKTMDELD